MSVTNEERLRASVRSLKDAVINLAEGIGDGLVTPSQGNLDSLVVAIDACTATALSLGPP